jgi:PAS domain S-box-containing protein
MAQRQGLEKTNHRSAPQVGEPSGRWLTCGHLVAGAANASATPARTLGLAAAKCGFRFPMTRLFDLTPTHALSEAPSVIAVRAKVAARLSWITAAIGLGLFAIDRFSGVPLSGDSMMTLVLAVMGALSWLLLRTRRYNSVAWLLVAFLFGMAASSTWFYGSVRTINIELILLGQVASGIFLSRKGLIFTTVSAIALLGVLTWADAAGVLPGDPEFLVGWRTWISQSLCVLGVAAMMYLNRTQMRMAQDLHLREAVKRLKAFMGRDSGQERFSQLFHTSPTPIFVQSVRTGVILDVNRAFEQVMGYSRGEVMNRRDDFLWLKDEQHQAFFQRTREARPVGWHPITAICRNGQQLALQISSEQDRVSDDGMRITAMRLPCNAVSVLPTEFAPLVGAAHV